MSAYDIPMVAVCICRGIGPTSRIKKFTVSFRFMSTVCSSLVSNVLLFTIFQFLQRNQRSTYLNESFDNNHIRLLLDLQRNTVPAIYIFHMISEIK